MLPPVLRRQLAKSGSHDKTRLWRAKLRGRGASGPRGDDYNRYDRPQAARTLHIAAQASLFRQQGLGKLHSFRAVPEQGNMYCGIYRLLNLVSTGHATEIWEAIHDATRNRYAIKKLREERVDREQTAYLRHDYAVGHNLDHPRIITVHDFGVHKGIPYLVMELYRVPNMKQLILQGVERVQHLVPKIVDQAAEALAYLADKDWVHRDIKPDNYLVSPEGDVKMIDFALAQKQKTGLAKMFAGKARTLQGTISYMSPEQIRGRPLDTKSDVYSFGCTVYQLLTGKLPFTGMNTGEVFGKHLHAVVPSPEVYNRNLTPECSDLLQRSLAKKSEDRPEISQFRREWNAIQLFKKPPSPPGEGGEEDDEDS